MDIYLKWKKTQTAQAVKKLAFETYFAAGIKDMDFTKWYALRERLANY